MEVRDLYNPCNYCQYYNKPYWSVVSPCENCTNRYATGGYVSTNYLDTLLKDEEEPEVWNDDDEYAIATRNEWRRWRDKIEAAIKDYYDQQNI